MKTTHFYITSLVGALSITLLGLKPSVSYGQSQSSFSLGLGFNYNNGGGAFGAPMFGFGNAGYSMGAIGGACFPAGLACAGAVGCGGWGNGGWMPGPGGFGPGIGGGMMPPPVVMPRPALPPLPPPAPMVPPHIAMGNQPWGGGWGFHPGPAVPGPMWGANCVPCFAGIQPMPIGPVAGGPVMGGGMGYQMGRGGFGMGGGFGDRLEWERSDTGDIVWGTAFGLGMQTTNVYPVAFPRNEPLYGPSWFRTGDRESTFMDRDQFGTGRGPSHSN